MTPNQRAKLFLGLAKDDKGNLIPATFSTPKDSINACNEIIKIFDDQLPPLTSDYWRKVKEEIIKIV